MPEAGAPASAPADFPGAHFPGGDASPVASAGRGPVGAGQPRGRSVPSLRLAGRASPPTAGGAAPPGPTSPPPDSSPPRAGAQICPRTRLLRLTPEPGSSRAAEGPRWAPALPPAVPGGAGAADAPSARRARPRAQRPRRGRRPGRGAGDGRRRGAGSRLLLSILLLPVLLLCVLLPRVLLSPPPPPPSWGAGVRGAGWGLRDGDLAPRRRQWPQRNRPPPRGPSPRGRPARPGARPAGGGGGGAGQVDAAGRWRPRARAA